MGKTKEKAPWLRWGISGLLVIWAFILGVLVGQGSLASDQQLDSLRKLSLSWFGINFSKENDPQSPLRDPDLSFYDQLASTDNSARQPGSSGAPPAPVQPTQPTQPPQPTGQNPAAGQVVVSPDSGAPPAPTAIPPVAPPQATQPATTTPSPDTRNNPAPLNQVRPYQPDVSAGQTGAPSTSAADEAPGGRFTVQVGSFKDERQAQELATRLKRSGFPAYISRVEIAGAGTRLRVRVGGYANLDQAQNVATNLRIKENVAAYVTRND